MQEGPLPTLRIMVNGESHTVSVDGDTPLLWVLRDHLGVGSPKYGCGRGYCGACMVQLDGGPVPSCMIPVETVGERMVTTIEGLSDDGSHPVQRAWVAERVPQCGYCQAGQIMSAAALLERDPDPSPESIEAAMSGNVCRCGTYPRIRRAIARASRLLAEGETRPSAGEGEP